MKTITAQIYSPTTETAKDEVLTAMGAEEQNVNVVRDANGKVIQMAYNVPDDAAATITNAVNAVGAVIAVQSTPIVGGETLINWAGGVLLTDLGFNESGYDYALDGNGYILVSGEYGASYKNYPLVPGNTYTFKATVKLTVPSPAVDGAYAYVRISMAAANTSSPLQINVDKDGVVTWIFDGSNQGTIESVDLAQAHDIEVVSDFNGMQEGVVTVKFDGETLYTGLPYYYAGEGSILQLNCRTSGVLTPTDDTVLLQGLSLVVDES